MLGENTQASFIFEAKFSWDEDQAFAFNSALTLIGVVGLAFGSLTGGRVSAMFGLRKSLICCTLINIVGNLIKVTYLSYPGLLIGRALFGFGTGVLSFCLGKCINETVPGHLM